MPAGPPKGPEKLWPPHICLIMSGQESVFSLTQTQAFCLWYYFQDETGHDLRVIFLNLSIISFVSMDNG